MYFPVIYSAYSSMKVLTMSKVEGTKITEATYEKGYDQELVAERFATGMFEQIFAHGFFFTAILIQVTSLSPRTMILS